MNRLNVVVMIAVLIIIAKQTIMVINQTNIAIQAATAQIAQIVVPAVKNRINNQSH